MKKGKTMTKLIAKKFLLAAAFLAVLSAPAFATCKGTEAAQAAVSDAVDAQDAIADKCSAEWRAATALVVHATDRFQALTRATPNCRLDHDGYPAIHAEVEAVNKMCNVDPKAKP
jgi:hypothetical protein